MLHIRNNIFLAMVLALGLWACAPRSAPAPVIIGGASVPVSEYPVAPHGRGSVVVQPGDTLYAISRYHQAALQELVAANNLEAPYVIKPGQVLRLPDQRGAPLPSTPVASSQTGHAKASPVQGGGERLVETQRISPMAAGMPTVQAEKKPAAVMAQNEFAMASANSPMANSGANSGEDQTSALSLDDEAIPVQPKPAPARKPIAVEKKAAATPAAVPVAFSAPPASQNSHVRFLWPAKGPILSDFGPKQNGLHNDGINIAMPPNGPVFAAGDGIVSYAGNGLRGYGNLLLIRHDGGWVTAYAHNSELLVEKGATVRRGQVIAKAGRSGGVPQDQLHFEIRQGAKAVDPKPLLVGG
jgi:murein DD-endopeptidase MepM/ murein hydrolase activator NlpD